METILEETPIVVIASHDQKRIAKWANRIIELDHGRAIEIDPASLPSKA